MPIMSFYCSRGIEAQANTSTIENPALKWVTSNLFITVLAQEKHDNIKCYYYCS
jgi:hypothetical protein